MKWNAAGLATQPEQKITGMTLNEYQNLLQSDKKVLVNFYADWCAPCKKMLPYMLQLQKDLSNKVVIIRLNADEHKTLLNELKVAELPTLLLYEKSKIKWQYSGFISEEDLKKQL
jgi:thioredoxin